MTAGSVREWLDHVARDPDAAWDCAHGPRPVCDRAAFFVQQAAEELVKAARVSAGIHPPRLHNLGALVALLPADFAERERFQALSRCSKHAILFRYPGGAGDPEPEPSPAEIDGWISEIATLRRTLEARLAGGSDEARR